MINDVLRFRDKVTDKNLETELDAEKLKMRFSFGDKVRDSRPRRLRHVWKKGSDYIW